MFKIGKEYLREDLLRFLGSKQQQSGIIWGPLNEEYIILTSGGRHGAKAGYQDKCHANGSWTYFGQGSKGDQDICRHSNRLLSKKDKRILLFTTREPTPLEVERRQSWAKYYKFEGTFTVTGWETVRPLDGTRKGDALLQFTLEPIAV